MRKMINLFLPTFLLFTILSCSNQSSERRLLKFNLEKGKTYESEMVVDMDQDVMNQKNKIGFNIGYIVNVAEDDGTVKTLNASYKDFKMNMNVMGQEINIDASKKPDTTAGNPANPMQMMTNVFSGILGKTFTMKVTADGKIVDVTGFAEIINSMVDNISVNEEMKAGMTASLKDQFNAEKIKEMFAPMFSAYPNKEIAVGDKWTNSYDLPSQGVKTTTNYTVKSFQGDNIVIGLDSKITPSGQSDNPALADMKMSGTQTGTMTMNAKSGWVVDAELNQNFEASGATKMKVTSKIKMLGKEKS